MPVFGGLDCGQSPSNAPSRARSGRRAIAAALLSMRTAVALFGGLPARADEVDDRLAAIERAIAALQAELATLRAERAASQPGAPAPGTTAAPAGDVASRLSEVERRQEIQAEEIERLDLGSAVVVADQGVHGLGDAASKVYKVEQGLSIGGYGEMLYESPDSSDDSGARSGENDQIDFLRAILYVGYKFNDAWLFNSEIEFEHAKVGEGAGGEAAVEFAYIDRLIQPQVNARAGLVLVPMGFLNELHEPPLFLGAKRPETERLIVPSTWRENGLGLFGQVGPFSYRTYAIGGLDAAGFNAEDGLREGRQEGSESIAEDFGWVGRLDYTATPGFLAGFSFYTGDSGQELSDVGGPIHARTSIFEGHVDWRWRGLEARALYADASVDDVARLNDALGFTGSESIGESMQGGYLQVGYDLFAHRGTGRSLIPYGRWERYDTQHEVPAGFSRDPANDAEVFTLGIAWKPLDQIIFKLDRMDRDNEAGTGKDQWNVAVGYLF
jgi:hypothetical protein